MLAPEPSGCRRQEFIECQPQLLRRAHADYALNPFLPDEKAQCRDVGDAVNEPLVRRTIDVTRTEAYTAVVFLTEWQ